MNYALWNAKRAEYYVLSVRKYGDKFMARGKRLSVDGKLLQVCAGFVFETVKDAEAKCRDLVKTKLKNGYVLVAKEKVKDCVMKHFEVPADMQVTTEELVSMLVELRRERYVVFSDVSGIEDGYDVGVQYLGEFEDGQEYVKVFDRFGTARDCLIERISKMELTEKAIEAQEVSKRFGR